MSVTSPAIRTFHRKTKKGSIIKLVREHYLRKEIPCGWISCLTCSSFSDAGRCLLSSSPRQTLVPGLKDHFLIPDARVLLTQLDVIEDNEFGNNIIIMQSVLNDVRQRNLKTYSRLRALISCPDRMFYVFCNEYHVDTYRNRNALEKVDDYTDRLVQEAKSWYEEHIPGTTFILLTRDNFVDYVTSMKRGENLLMKVAKESLTVDATPKEMRFSYPEHLSEKDILIGIRDGKLKSGKLRTNHRNFLEARISSVIDGKECEILIQGREHLNRAIDQNVVAVQLLPQSEWVSESGVVLEPGQEEDDEAVAARKALSVRRPTGKVVGILKRNIRQFCGSLKERDKNLSRNLVVTTHLFVAKDSKIPLIRIESRNFEILQNQRIVVAIDSWPRFSRYPIGHYVRSLGEIGDRDAEREAILLEHNVAHDSFSKIIMNSLPDPETYRILPEEYETRQDFRRYNICSIDPVGCTDIDDALHCRDLGNGMLEVGVHIADVSHFVKENSPLDKEAGARGTTVYLQDTRIDMIPGVLSSNLCSLREHVERLTFSVVWIMDPTTADIVETKFCKSVIKSKAAMTYAEAQAKIDSKSDKSELSCSLRMLNQMAKRLKQKRIDDGALVLANAGEVKFMELESETHENTTQIQAKQMLETNFLVEEFMLLANISVAKKIYEDFPEIALLRKHPQPSAANFEELRKTAKLKGFEIDPSSGKSLSESLDKAVDKTNPLFNTMLRMLTTCSMTQAVYFCSGAVEGDIHHFGLAANIYTHFTSPIRRYADLMVHRLLAAAIDAAPLDTSLMTKAKMIEITDNINIRHHSAQLAARASTKVHTIFYVKNCKELIDVEAYVLEVLVVSCHLDCLYFKVNSFCSMPEWNHYLRSQSGLSIVLPDIRS